MKVGSVIRCLYHRHRKLIVISLHKITVVDPENIKGDFEGMCVCVCVWGGGGGGGGHRTPIYMLTR